MSILLERAKEGYLSSDLRVINALIDIAESQRRISIALEKSEGKQLPSSAQRVSNSKSSMELWELVEKELTFARTKFPDWQGDLVHAVSVAAEEMGEIVKDANNLRWRQKPVTVEQIKHEIVQTIAMLVRLYTETPVLTKGETDG